MNKRVRQAVLKLMLLQEEFTNKELAEAADVVSSDIGEFLREQRPKRRAARAPASTSTADQRSKIVRRLKDSDPQRYSILSEFELMLRRQEPPPSLEDIRHIGRAISKDFLPGKSRKEAIPRLMTLLVKMPPEMLREKLSKVLDNVQLGEGYESSYQKLAQYLIQGSNDSL